MEQNYRDLCVELFGTDDIAELRRIADSLNKKNTRNAGRKKMFSEKDVRDMENMRDHGVALRTIAEKYGTSRQVVGRYLSHSPAPGNTMRLTYMFRQHPCTVIDVDFLHQKISIQNKTADPIHRAFGMTEKPAWEDFEYFLRDRCFPETRGNKKELLAALGLTDYDPIRIVEKTQGRMADDDMWLKIRYYDRRTNENR